MATATTSTAPRRPLPWKLAAAGAALAAMLIAVIVTRTPQPVAPVAPALQPASQAQVDSAAAFAAARHELVALRAAVRDVPAIDAAMRDRMTVLGLVGSGRVPVAALQPAPPGVALGQSQAEAAERLAAARHELAALRAAIRDNPAIRDALLERTTLLELVAAGRIPEAALPTR